MLFMLCIAVAKKGREGAGEQKQVGGEEAGKGSGRQGKGEKMRLL